MSCSFSSLGVTESSGISDYASDPKLAGESLKACMRDAERFVPSERHEETPLYLGATAGMRLLNEVELQQVYEADSLEYLQALEIVTDRLETRVNFCKAHLMMVTCFDVSSKHR
uniref:Uncharacterized protein n=1 Tax=Knipowitschia caucasica TaxID=637954 RepID=A0AAV2LNG2_KNICA